MTSLVFFGSFQHFSTITLELLIKSDLFTINGVVTTPPKPGDRGVITKTHTQLYCESKNIPVFPLENLDDIPVSLEQPDFIVVSGYGKFIPNNWLNFPKIMPLNVHQSLLPQYAGRFPAQWAILQGVANTGVTIIKMTESFTDKGEIMAQATLPINQDDTSNSLYTKLYILSANIVIDTLPKILKNIVKPIPQIGKGFYARQLTREDGFFSPELLNDAANHPQLDRMLRALMPWPGVYTTIRDKNNQLFKMKIISVSLYSGKIELQKVHIEGKKPTLWSEISTHYTLSK